MVLVHSRFTWLSIDSPPIRGRDSRQHEGDYSDISHPCPFPAVLNRKAEQEWYREENENDVT
jgi:hypothetical protein